ncbi:Armadillo repeat-containing protein 2 [Apodemus speciosus]|uniref:Armadillo repeat-containing protein 2 n=1 Tax=Apodemus speciosus TaxID=105296 RepID=A0ABQ0F703_APOSI
MLSSNDQKLEKLDSFYRPPVSKQKTSAEIISEARNALRAVRTQRPFTPREDQRKLFGPASSRTPENRPPSSFSLHASSFELTDSKPVSGTRLRPLELAKTVEESSKTVSVGSSTARRNGTHLTASGANSHLKSPPLLTCDQGCRETTEQDATLLSQLRRGGDPGKRHARASSCPSSSDLSRQETRAASRASLQERETEPEVDEVFWRTRIVPILHQLEKEEDTEEMCAACTQLHRALEEGRMLRKKFKRRTVLLKALYKLVDVGSDPLSLKLAKLILALKVSGKNLLNVCKLVFKISRSEENDTLMQKDNILESLLAVLSAEDLESNTEAFLYCMGALKFISGSSGFLTEMVNKGAVEILAQLIKEITEDTEKHGACRPNAGHLLVQNNCYLEKLVMEQHTDDKDVCTNIARVFSPGCPGTHSVDQAALNQDLVIRIVFILGNLTAKSNQARELFSREPGSVDTLLTLFQSFYQLEESSPEPQLSEARPQAEAEDVLVKLTRVLANIAIHPRIGPVLAANPRVVGLLLTTLESKSLGDCAELVINTTAAINNLSFYQVQSSVLQHRKLHVAELLLKLLVSNNMDGILEAVRVFGNLSQDHDVCNFLMQKNDEPYSTLSRMGDSTGCWDRPRRVCIPGLHKFMIALLEARHQDICFSACGVLLNLTVDKEKRAVLKEGGGIKKLVDCLRDFGPGDWQLACLVCKTLWNFSENITNASECFGDDVTNTLLILLSTFLDEELALDGSFDQDLKSYHRLHWETEFKPVAQQLLKRIQSHHTLLEPLPVPSF